MTISPEQTAADWWAVAELAIAMVDFSATAARLAAMPDGPDGYGTGCTDRGGPGTVANPTLAVITKQAGGRCAAETDDGLPTADTWAVNANRDRIAMLLGIIETETAAVLNAARRIAGAKRLIDNRADSRYGRQTSLVDCLACEKPITGVGNDRVRSGYCPACHQGWLRYLLSERAAGREAVHEVYRRNRRRHIVSTARNVEGAA